MPAHTGFHPHGWLRNAHAQTLWPSLLRRRINLQLTRERIELPDGDFLDLDWGENKQGPLAIIFHGLEGSGKSSYVRGIMAALTHHGWQTVVVNFRGCSGEPNRLARAYHSGDTGDIAHVVTQLRKRMPDTFIAAIGYSLGGNALLKYLGEIGSASNINAAIAVSVPFNLDNAAHTLRHSAFGLYQHHLLKNLKQTLLDKHDILRSHIDINTALQSQNFHEFDHRVTARLHGFASVDDYYAKSSSNQYIPAIHTPTLILHAEDDPFLSPAAIPGTNDLPDTVTLELSKHGGHVGFINRQGYWLEQRIPAFLNHLSR